MTTAYVAIGAVLVIGFGVWLAFRQARKRGRAEAQRDHFETSTEHAREAHETHEDVARLPDADLRDELRDHYRD
jgi:ABC-type nickel/cobalt efflux system permease component RcnA